MTDVRLPHCTPSVFSGHNPLCDRNGEYCSEERGHWGPCSPHGRPETQHDTWLHDVYGACDACDAPTRCGRCKTLFTRNQRGEFTEERAEIAPADGGAVLIVHQACMVRGDTIA